MHHLARLVLSHQEQLQCMSRSTGVIFHFGRCQERGIVPNRMECLKAWKTTYAESPEKIREPIRVVLLKRILASLYLRVSELAKVTEQTILDKYLIKGVFYETIWEAKMEKVIPKPAGRTMSLEQLNTTLEELSTLCRSDAIERLKILKPLDRLWAEATLPVLLNMNPMTQAGMRMYELMHQLMELSLWHLIDATMRAERGRPTPLAETVRSLAFPQRGMSSSSHDGAVQVSSRTSSAATLLPLMNDGTLCYINSTVNMICWACLACPAFLSSLPATWRHALATSLENATSDRSGQFISPLFLLGDPYLLDGALAHKKMYQSSCHMCLNKCLSLHLLAPWCLSMLPHSILRLSHLSC